ncbi:Aste57867_16715 [Aphanomyces stellatus]|uniref:Aste57867_16715 protein n=1 Tax=Aphanomyces stellatus TaxID=120398 RepID=A0A485L693_9STRA|nr:hypothetical protein As57867_016658 [Aphanomyces stellatus]VFT93485.1 Aste57867_16715 [Aphanomyces stellatus]
MEEPFIRFGRELTPTEKMAIVTMLQNTLRDGKLPYGTIQSTSVVFKVHRNTVAKLWISYKQGSIATKKTGRVGPKQRYSKDEIVSLVQDVPQRKRSTMRDVAEATGISPAMVCRSLKTGVLQCRTSSLKLLLTDPNKMERIVYCLAHVRREAPDVGEADAGSRGRTARRATAHKQVQVFHSDEGLQEFEFSSMWDVVHLDEKWFNADKDRGLHCPW